MPINASYEYLNAEKRYLAAQTLEERITATEEMIKTAPKHKGSENLLALLRSRIKKLRESAEKAKKSGRSSRTSLKKEGFQCILIGLPNSGKSALLAALTNARPKISHVPFTTAAPEVGTLDYEGVKAQLVDLPAIGAETFDSGIVNTADLLLLVIEKLDELPLLEQHLTKAPASRIVILNKSDLLSEEQQRRLEMTLKSRRLNALLVSALSGVGIMALKKYIFQAMRVIRVYTKEPGKSASKIPIVLPEGSTVRDVAESILHGFSLRIKETRLTGPSSKFPNQRIGLQHVLKDRDIVEFHTT